MPLIRISTNAEVEKDVAQVLAADVTSVVAEHLGKPESVTMALVETGLPMTFGGSGLPTALFEIEGIETGTEPTAPLCEALSDFAEHRFGVPSERVFVKLTDVPRGYWAGNRRVY